MTRTGNNSKQRGYTLMEMMVVLALIAIATALVMPSMAHGYGSLELRLAGTSIATAFQQARVHAIYEGRNYVVVFGPEQNRQRELLVVRDDGSVASHVTLGGNFKLMVEQRGAWTEDVLPVHFFPDGHAEGVQLDLANAREQHLQLLLDPFTARTRVTQIYSSAPQAAESVTVIRGGSR